MPGMNGLQRVVPVIGAFYVHRSGTRYRCIGEVDGGFRMKTRKGWVVTVRDIWLTSEGRIFWMEQRNGHKERKEGWS